MVTVGVADGVDAAPMDGESVDIRYDNPISTGICCRRGGGDFRSELHDQFVSSVSCDPIDVELYFAS